VEQSDRDDFRTARGWFFGVVIGLVILGGVSTVISRAFDLAWFPWEVKMKTGMIRASNSYVTTQQEALRTLRSGYEDASTDGQRNALVRQMRVIADTIPGDVQPDIRSFLALQGG
jgi:hypothetical protein